MRILSIDNITAHNGDPLGYIWVIYWLLNLTQVFIFVNLKHISVYLYLISKRINGEEICVRFPAPYYFQSHVYSNIFLVVHCGWYMSNWCASVIYIYILYLIEYQSKHHWLICIDARQDLYLVFFPGSIVSKCVTLVLCIIYIIWCRTLQ